MLALVLLLALLGNIPHIAAAALPQQTPNDTPATGINATIHTHAVSHLTLSTAAPVVTSTPPAAVSEPSDCTMTLRLPVIFSNLGQTLTVHVATVTHTNEVDCRGCGAVTVERWGGHGPVVHHTATVTVGPEDPLVKQVYVCMAGGGEDEGI